MFGSLARAVFGTSNDRALKGYRRQVAAINAFEPEFEKLDDEALKAKTAAFKSRLAAGETLDDILEEAFAVVREASKRVLGMRHFDVQMIGAMVLHSGKIAEMKTGEGKTLVATLAVYLNALSGKGVHLVTVNDYLASRDAEWMGRLYGFLGLTTRRHRPRPGRQPAPRRLRGRHHLRHQQRIRLRLSARQHEIPAGRHGPAAVQLRHRRRGRFDFDRRGPHAADHLRPSDEPTALYAKVDEVVTALLARPVSEDGTDAIYEKDEKARTVVLTETGSEAVEQLLRDYGLLTEGNLYDIFNISLIHHVQQSLRARVLYTRDVDYIVRDGKVVIIDEFTGRMMEGRRYSDGLHQALEAKEKVTVEKENQTLASITFQNYFRLFPKLAGMTGTAMTEADEFEQIYKLAVVEIPTNVPVTRKDHDDEVYRSAGEKYEAVAKLIEECRERGQPVLVGTTSIEKSEIISNLLKKKKIPHSVLNARFHEQEATIVAQAGAPRRHHHRHQHGRPRHRHQTRRQSRHAAETRRRTKRSQNPRRNRRLPRPRQSRRRPVRHRHRTA